MSIHKRIVRDSSDVDVEVVGSLYPGETLRDIIKPSDFPDTKALKLQAVFHSIQSKVVVLLYWEHEGGPDRLMLPLEGRGILDLTRFGGRENPRSDGWTGNIIVAAQSEMDPSETPRHFTLSLEFSKQRS